MFALGHRGIGVSFEPCGKEPQDRDGIQRQQRLSLEAEVQRQNVTLFRGKNKQIIPTFLYPLRNHPMAQSHEKKGGERGKGILPIKALLDGERNGPLHIFHLWITIERL
jgi:hypothetical protein